MFRFKQFTVRQEHTAMKVCTDACVLGAYADVDAADVETAPVETAPVETAPVGNVVTSNVVAPDVVANNVANGAEPGNWVAARHPVAPTRLLDIGTGTGLLALMAAQRNPRARIDAVELDGAAADQARQNVAASPFADRIRVLNTPIQAFSGGPYDRILTNPPFYTNHLRSPDAAVNRALHTDELPLPDLLAAVARLLAPTGQWWVLLPPAQTAQLTQLATPFGLRPFRQLAVRHHARKPIFRCVTGFHYVQQRSDTDDNVVKAELAIYEADAPNPYTDAFRQLLQPFYLIF